MRLVYSDKLLDQEVRERNAGLGMRQDTWDWTASRVPLCSGTARAVGLAFSVALHGHEHAGSQSAARSDSVAYLTLLTPSPLQAT